MKKYLALTAVAVLVAFAAPAFAATNPFMDVPLNHWAYDAIGQLAAQGILSGYPDGTYKGKQPTTRYEMASALARALAVVDLTKASKADVEMLKRLVIEFKDELDALGVKVDELDSRVSVIESRLGGWKIGGQLRLDIADTSRDPEEFDDASDGSATLSRARVFFERNFGEDESIHFYGRLDINGDAVRWESFYADFPVFADSRLYAGRFQWDMENAYYYVTVTDGVQEDSPLTDRRVDGLGWKKSIGLGNLTAYLARPAAGVTTGQDPFRNINAWEFFAMGQLQFNEQFGFDIGFQYFKGDDASLLIKDNGIDHQFDSAWTAFGGVRFNFTPDIALKGIFYHQKWELDDAGVVNWNPGIDDDANTFKVILDVKQDVLKFTSLWLAYESIGEGFVIPQGEGDSVYLGGRNWSNVTSSANDIYITPADHSIFAIGANQKWNDKWSTSVYFAQHEYDFDNGADPSVTQWALGIDYKYNPSVRFGLYYSHLDIDTDNALLADRDEDFIRFRTTVNF